MTIYAGKTALVTGARGIAAEIVENLYEQGANVIVVSSSASCVDLAQKLSNHGGTFDTSKVKKFFRIMSDPNDPSPPTNKIIGIQSDLSSAAAASELASKAVHASKETFGGKGKIDFLILCGGVMPMATLEQVTPETWTHIFNVNVVGPVFLAKALAPNITDGGRILFFSTSLTISSTIQPNYLPYTATKGAIEQVVRTLSKDPSLTSRGISTTALSPGPTATKLFLEGKPDALISGIKSANPYGRLGESEDIAAAVDAVLGPRSQWFNGANIRVNGGSIV